MENTYTTSYKLVKAKYLRNNPDFMQIPKTRKGTAAR